MVEIVELESELIDLKRDLAGLWGLLCDLSSAVDQGAGISESELFLLSEIAYRDSQTVENMIQSVKSMNYYREANQKALNEVFNDLDTMGRAKLIVFAYKLKSGEIDTTA